MNLTNKVVILKIVKQVLMLKIVDIIGLSYPLYKTPNRYYKILS